MRHGNFTPDPDSKVNWRIIRHLLPYLLESRYRVALALLFLLLAKGAILLMDVRHKYPQLVVDEGENSPSAEHEASGQRELQAVTAALNKLPPEQRLALTLVAIEGKTYAEAAEILEVPVGTIMSRIARARRHLVEQRSRSGNE